MTRRGGGGGVGRNGNHRKEGKSLGWGESHQSTAAAGWWRNSRPFHGESADARPRFRLLRDADQLLEKATSLFLSGGGGRPVHVHVFRVDMWLLRADQPPC